MTLDTGSNEAHRCKQCEVAVECCAVCEREDCSDLMCYRCLRLALGLTLPQPHAHGG